MLPTHSEALRIGVRVDAHSRSGVGHFVRQSALIEELAKRGHAVSLIGETDLEWVREAAARLGLAFEATDSLWAGWDVVMIDGYEIPGSVGRRLRSAGVAVATMVDGEFGTHQEADLYVDQNLGSRAPAGSSAHWLVGPEFVLLREIVTSRRRQSVPAENDPPRCLVVFGGSDPYRGAPVATELLASCEAPVEIVAIGATPELRSELAALTLGSPGHRLEILDPLDDLPAVAVTCDFAVSAAGSTVWEFACLGLPTAIVCVADNQELGYKAASASLTLGLGHLASLRSDLEVRARARAQLARLAESASLRQQLAEAGQTIVDGRGRERVADALEALAQQ